MRDRDGGEVVTEQQGRVPDEVLDRLVELDEAATDGPWNYPETLLGQPCTTVFGSDRGHVGYVPVMFTSTANGTLIAEMRSSIRALVAEVREHRAREASAAYRYRAINVETGQVAGPWTPGERSQHAEGTPWREERQAVFSWEVVDGE